MPQEFESPQLTKLTHKKTAFLGSMARALLLY